MHLLRRVALRAIQAQNAPVVSRRSIATSTSIFSQVNGFSQISTLQKRSYIHDSGKSSESPETIEPSRYEQRRSVKSESVLDSNNKDGSVMQQAAETISNAVSDATGAVTSAMSSMTGKQDSANQEPGKILYVGNLYFDLSPARLREEFSSFGEIVNCKIVTDSSGLSKGFGYIEYAELDSAAKAIAELDRQLLEGRRMTVQYHIRKQRVNSRFAERNPPAKTLFIGNMSFQMTDKDINNLFKDIKNLLDVRVAIDRRSGQPRGFAHADFTDVESATQAKALLENKEVYGRSLKIDYGLPSTTAANPRSSYE